MLLLALLLQLVYWCSEVVVVHHRGLGLSGLEVGTGIAGFAPYLDLYNLFHVLIESFLGCGVLLGVF